MILPAQNNYAAGKHLHWEYDHWRQDKGRAFRVFGYGTWASLTSLVSFYKKVYAPAAITQLTSQTSPFLHYVSSINQSTGTITMSYGVPPARRWPKTSY